MAIQTINIGTNPNDGTGDDLRTAFDKVNDNFAELLAVGGETNTASNLGIGEGVFKQKSNLDLQFKKLRNTDGKLSISSDDNTIIINNINPDDNDIGRVQVDNGDIITATSSNFLIGIKGGTNISTIKNGNDIEISSAFEIVNDATPQLGGNLSLVNNNIIGPGNITAVSAIDGDSLNIDTLTVNQGSTLTGPVTADGLITANAGITVTSGQTISGALNGSFQGSISGTVDLNSQEFSGAGKILLDTANLDGADDQENPVLLGSEAGLGYLDNTNRSLIVQTNQSQPSIFISRGTSQNIPQTALELKYTIDTIGNPGLTYGNGAGPTLSFNVDSTGSQDKRELGSIGALQQSSGVNSVFLFPIDPTYGTATPLRYEFRSNGIVLLDALAIDGGEATLTTFNSNQNLTLNANGSGTVDFYGAYQFPRTIGNAGEVLTVPLSGTTLEWGAGGGGGGGASSFVGLSDTPASYAGGSADALKMVRVAASGTALEFVTVDSVVDATYIEGKGFLPKGGGTMSGNINLGTNDITNGGTITATTFSGTHSGDVSGATDVTTTNLFVTTIDTTDSSAVSFTPGVEMESFLTVKSSLNVLDTTTTKNLEVTNNANISGTLTADNFQLSGSGAPSFSSGSDINFTAIGQLNTNAPLVPTVDNSITLGTASFKWANIHATTFTGNLTGDVTGNVAGNVTGNVDGIVGGSTPAAVTGTVITANSNFAGPLTGDVTGNLSGNVNATTVDVGNLHIETDSIETASNGILRLAAQGTGYIELDGNTHVNGVTSYAANEDLTVSATATPVTIDATKQISYMTTANWTSVGADYGYGNLANGTTEGQTKIIKMVNRGQFSANGGATFTDRYLVVNLTINGSSGTLNVSENSEYGAVTLIWHNASWWVVSQFDS